MKVKVIKRKDGMESLTVRELIEILQQQDPNLPVMYDYDCNWVRIFEVVTDGKRICLG